MNRYIVLKGTKVDTKLQGSLKITGIISNPEYTDLKIGILFR